MTHSHQPHPDGVSVSLRCAVITVSDTRTQETDKSGQLMQSLLTAADHLVTHYEIIRDEPEHIATLVRHLAQRDDVQAILLNGGTGIAPRDTTYDAIAGLLHKTLPGFGEIFRQLSYEEIGSRAIASRAIAGIHTAPAQTPHAQTLRTQPLHTQNEHTQNEPSKHTLIFSVPGSSKAVNLAMETLIIPELVHLVKLVSSSG